MREIGYWVRVKVPDSLTNEEVQAAIEKRLGWGWQPLGHGLVEIISVQGIGIKPLEDDDTGSLRQ